MARYRKLGTNKATYTRTIENPVIRQTKSCDTISLKCSTINREIVNEANERKRDICVADRTVDRDRQTNADTKKRRNTDATARDGQRTKPSNTRRDRGRKNAQES